MRSRDVAGKKIVQVIQRYGSPGDCRPMEVNVSEIVLEDGTRLVPYTIETDYGDYWNGIAVIKPKGDE